MLPKERLGDGLEETQSQWIGWLPWSLVRFEWATAMESCAEAAEDEQGETEGAAAVGARAAGLDGEESKEGGGELPESSRSPSSDLSPEAPRPSARAPSCAPGRSRSSSSRVPHRDSRAWWQQVTHDSRDDIGCARDLFPN